MAGQSLRRFESRPKMPSKALLAMLAKREATSMAVRTPETREKEVTSRAKEIPVVTLESEIGVEGSGLVVKECDRKRNKKDKRITRVQIIIARSRILFLLRLAIVSRDGFRLGAVGVLAPSRFSRIN